MTPSGSNHRRLRGCHGRLPAQTWAHSKASAKTGFRRAAGFCLADRRRRPIPQQQQPSIARSCSLQLLSFTATALAPLTSRSVPRQYTLSRVEGMSQGCRSSNKSSRPIFPADPHSPDLVSCTTAIRPHSAPLLHRHALVQCPSRRASVARAIFHEPSPAAPMQPPHGHAPYWSWTSPRSLVGFIPLASFASACPMPARMPCISR